MSAEPFRTWAVIAEIRLLSSQENVWGVSMNHPIVRCLSAVLSAAGLVTLLGQAGLAQQPAPVPVDSLLSVLTSDNAGFDNYGSASRELAARGAEAVPLRVKREELRIADVLP